MKKSKTKNLYGIDIILTPERQELMEGGWEYNRLKSMVENVKPGDVVFDIGAEQGDISAILAKKTGKLVAFEPSPIMWPHIRANFEANELELLDYYAGFVSNVTDEHPQYIDYKDSKKDGFPLCAYDELDDTRGFRHLHEQAISTKQITLDDYCLRTGIYPDMVTIDVEGSEYNVLIGMDHVLDKSQPIVYVSVHHDFLHNYYHKFFNHIAEFFRERNYECAFLGHDHESHYVFYKKSLIEIKEVL